VADIAIFGDLSGHYWAWSEALTDLGVDIETGDVPDDLWIVQVGDLVHKGPDSAKNVELADRLLASGRYVQLVGNHESQYVGGIPFWGRTVGAQAAATMKSWWREGKMQVAIGLDTEHGSLLVTHAGLTFDRWVELGRPEDVAEAARKVNDMPKGAKFGPGWMLDAGRHGEKVGPVWAHPTREVYEGWVDGAPFGQVHGHCSLINWRDKTWWAPPLTNFTDDYDVYGKGVRRVEFRLGGRWWAAVDPGVGKFPVDWAPLVVEGDVLLEG
jgi:hypothetical protein